MVNIIEFRRRDEIVPRTVAEIQPGGLPRGHSAEIVIFPGVRIERQPLERGDDDLSKGAAKKVKRPAGRGR